MELGDRHLAWLCHISPGIVAGILVFLADNSVWRKIYAVSELDLPELFRVSITRLLFLLKQAMVNRNKPEPGARPEQHRDTGIFLCRVITFKNPDRVYYPGLF
jgi:hypothetical protein